ncbi:Protein translocase subunit SecA like [Heracleum sosnowskyi]|uniref:Protein translocase subunit SecA like n=1 Tax=Heracleum sosnowskyi TaxID=360622 RepID=A0AAD8I4G4_9APIA|nr:Protein translocase subunit SecA like [Heracleum sosnowskyi]
MEGKKLDFNAPLLSVRSKRKYIESPPPCKHLSVPARKSVSELSEVTKPAAVPFVWECTPGRSKVEAKIESLPQEEFSTTPRFPPGRAFDIRKRVSGELLNPQNVSRLQIEASPFNESVSIIGMNEASAIEDEDNAVLESVDALSRTESCSWSCSISGSSGSDGAFTQSSTPTTFRADPQTLDLMMARFLPAARAMIIETPKYAKKKKSVETQSPRHVKKVVSGELRPFLERYGSNTASDYSPYKRNAFSEFEDDECDDRHRKSGIACGLLPRLSVKKSLHFFDPVPRIKSRPQSPISSAPEVRRMARTAHSGPLPQIQHEKQSLKDNYWDDIKIGVKQQELIEKKLLGVDQVRHSTDSYRKESLLPRISSRSACISPYRNEKPRSPFHDGASFLGVPKIVKNTESGNVTLTSKESDKFLDFSAYQMFKRESDLLSSLAEKILYIDLANNTEVPMLDSEEQMLKNLGESRGTEESCYLKYLDTTDMEKSTTLGSTAAGSASSHCKLNITSITDHRQVLKQDQDIGHEARSLRSSVIPQSPLPPPLPKSPSEPWLWRNLSYISLRNPFSYGQPKKKNPKNSSTSSKWETIVKRSNISHDHKRYYEELVSHVSKP